MMTTTDWIQAIAMVVLVAITGIYVWRTYVISNATRKQAETSVKMAEEMRAQRLSEARPYLLLRLKLEGGDALLWEGHESSKPRGELEVTIINAGKGPAINLDAALWHRENTYFIADRKGFLAPSEEWQANISRLNAGMEEKEGWLPELREVFKYDEPTIAVEYQDIHKRKWAS
jgi:hypothetical protein